MVRKGRDSRWGTEEEGGGGEGSHIKNEDKIMKK